MTHTQHIRQDLRPSDRACAYALCVALLLVALAFWLPWIAHPTAALELSGQDLGEFVKFVPEIRLRHFPRQLFYLSPLGCSLIWVLLAADDRGIYPRWLRSLFLLIAIVLLPGLLPPVWGHPRDLLTPEFRMQAIALAFAFATILAHGLVRRMPVQARAALASSLSVLALTLPSWGFWAVHRPILAAYDTPTAETGCGVWVHIAAWAVAALCSSRPLWTPARSPARDQI